MSLLKNLTMSKKRFKFQVSLFIDELTAVSSVTGVLYCKVRLQNGGTYTDSTGRQTVKDHCVVFQSKFDFTCKMSAAPNTGILEPCVVRLSVRKEVRGGLSASKVGYVDLNLAEFAGSGQTSRHCLLEAYNEKHRLDNSILKIVVGMQLLSGDPCYKVPTVHDVILQLPSDPTLSEADHGNRLDSTSSGFGSLPRPTPKYRRTPAHACSEMSDTVSLELRHTRNSSQVSLRSDYGSQHSRTPSNISQVSDAANVESVAEQDNNGSAAGTKKVSTPGRTLPPRPPPPNRGAGTGKMTITPQSRVDDTRVDNEDIVSKLIEGQDFTATKSTGDGHNLQLYISSDGQTTLGGQHLQQGVYQAVVFQPSSTSSSKNIVRNSHR